MSPLSNSVYSSVFTYNPKAVSTSHHQCFDRAVSLDISVLVVRFNLETKHTRAE